MITVLMSIELMLNAVNINLIAFSAQHSDLTGQIFAIFTITVAAGEAAVGLGTLHRSLPAARDDRRRPGHGSQGLTGKDRHERAALADPGPPLPGRRWSTARCCRQDVQEGGGHDRLRHRRHRRRALPAGHRRLPDEHRRAADPGAVRAGVLRLDPAGPIHTVVDGVQNFNVGMGFLLDPLSGGDALRGHLRGLPDPRLLGRLHGARGRATGATSPT